MKPLYCVIGLLAIGEAQGQWWSDAGVVIDEVGEIGRFYVDTTSNELYSPGFWVYNFGEPDQSLRYLVWNGTSWALSVSLDMYAWTFANYHDTLYMGGAFTFVDGMPMPYAASRVSGVWQACGAFNDRVNKFKVIDDELYAVGPFTAVDGVPCKGVAKRVHNGWECVGELGCSSCLVADIIQFQDRLVVSGSIAFGSAPYHHIMQYENGTWSPVGPGGIYGGLSGGGPLAVFQDELYVGGLIPLSAGNAGYCIQKWNGSVWSAVGEGLQDETGGTGQSIKVRDLMVHDGKLFVSGGFTYAGHEYAPRIATWDGVQWCSVGGEFSENEVTGMAFYNDTLYIACGLDAVVDGQSIVGVAKFIAPEFENNCSGGSSVVEATTGSSLSLGQQGRGSFVVRGLVGRGRVTFFDTLGKELASYTATGEMPFTAEGLGNGICVARLPDGTSVRVVLGP